MNRRPQTGTADDLVYRAAKILDRFRVKRERSNLKGFKDFSLNAKTRILYVPMLALTVLCVPCSLDSGLSPKSRNRNRHGR